MLAIRGDDFGALTAAAKLSARSPALRLCARELALVIATGTFAPDIVEHISGGSGVSITVCVGLGWVRWHFSAAGYRPPGRWAGPLG